MTLSEYLQHLQISKDCYIFSIYGFLIFVTYHILCLGYVSQLKNIAKTEGTEFKEQKGFI